MRPDGGHAIPKRCGVCAGHGGDSGVPAHNKSVTIEQTTRSYLFQTYPPAQVIVVADHRSDATAARGYGRHGDRGLWGIQGVRAEPGVASCGRRPGGGPERGLYFGRDHGSSYGGHNACRACRDLSCNVTQRQHHDL